MLWQAFTADQPVALLIDEIDKADIEFPNDLLRELDRMEFYCYETRELIRPKTARWCSSPQQRKKNCPTRFAPLLFPLHQVPRCHHHAPDRGRAFPRPETRTAGRRHEDLLRHPQPARPEKSPAPARLLDWLKLLLAEDIPCKPCKPPTKIKVAVPRWWVPCLKNEQDVTLFENWCS